MTLYRLLIVLAVALAPLGFPGFAWAHPGHGPLDESAAVRLASEPRVDVNAVSPTPQATRRHAPSAIALVAGVVALLAGMPHRRRALALVLVLLLGTVAFEGAVHATLHLGHLPHADGLAIGGSPAQQATADLDSAPQSATPLALLDKAPEWVGALVTEIAVAANQGRAPPVFPA